MSRDPLFASPRFVDRLEDCFFYHTVELPGFGLVHGHWDLRGRFDDYVGGVGVAGKSVLDAGAATGHLSFEAERRGAARVVSHDMSDVRQQTLVPFRDNLYSRDREAWAARYGAEIERWKNAYWLCHRLYGSRAEVFYGDVYDLPPALGPFDVSIVGSLLEHLSDPVTALASIARLTKETIVVVTPLLDTEERIARFEPTADNPAYDFTWWTYSLGLYREVFGVLGFRLAHVTRAVYHYDYGDLQLERATLVAVRVKGGDE
jgi:SAM-dependent methyltransferase